MAVGSFIFIIPHMLSEEYNWLGQANNLNDSHICSANNTDPCANRKSADASWFLYLFMLAQFVHGIGFTPMFTLGTAYVDDNASTESTSIYLGLIYAITALGVAAGFIGGGQLLNIWVDFDKVDTTLVLYVLNFRIYDTLTPLLDPRWVGAWWLGFVITAVLFFLVAIPILGYPKNLPGTAKIREARITDEQRERKAAKANDKRPIIQKFLDFPKAIFQLIKIPTFLLIVFGACAETLIIGGLAAFAPKVLEEKFDSNPGDAGLIMGGVTLGGGAGGMVLGGVLIKIFKLNLKGMVRLCSMMSFLALLVGAGFFINCPDVNFAGVTQPYMINGIMDPMDSLNGYCNEGCKCNTFNYEPVCGADGFTYFSPCHAGCTDNYTVGPMAKSYADCQCVQGRLFNSSDFTTSPTAVSGECATTCPIMGLFVFLLFLGMLFTLTTCDTCLNGNSQVRCVPDEHRALGLGLQWVALRLLGTIPGPVLTGYVIDTSCSVWQDLCGEQGSCWFYDRQEMSWRLFTWWCAVKVFSGTTFFLSSLFYKPPPEKPVSVKNDASKSLENGTKPSLSPINHGGANRATTSTTDNDSKGQ
ncbi:hypothetical protein KUTeg_013298 [Tegillarca granosa]|uniref:Solute carrier organic anion transporter family member n=1 Tax=Tegillarca granosa TaxID=220873 RepID=A0ABQ9ET99_TEGGR|nr:hypothetical protein KUTeg_013298 [Tegillarca granosa]